MDSRRRRSLTDRIRDVVLLATAAAVTLQVLPSAFAAWDATKPATNSALVSSEIRANWAALEAAIGNPDTTPLTIKQADLAAGARFAAAPTYKPGSDANYDATVSGLLRSLVDTTQHANSGTGETDFTSISFPAGALANNGQVARFTFGGTNAANANTKTIKFKFGATTLTLQNGGTNGGSWGYTVWVVRTGATSQKILVIGGSRSSGTGDFLPVSSSAAETLSGAITVKTTGQSGTASNDILQEVFLPEILG